MKRSEIEKSVSWAKELLKKNNFFLPPFAYWKITDWEKEPEKTKTIRRTMLGWDITDFGMGNFPEIGAVLFTIRNGDMDDPGTGTPYAEKVILLTEGQRLPMHYHANKTEDIINRGGGIMFMKLYHSKENGEPDMEKEVTVFSDGFRKVLKPGEEFYVEHGASVTLTPGLHHIFGAKKGSGDLIAGEVSSVNDDKTDNYFYEKVSRFSDIEEDVPKIHLLCNEY
jgi:D-lyxose ketol-isomerase